MNIPIHYCTSPMSTQMRSNYLDYAILLPWSRHDLLLKAGEICRNIYFVESGLLRCFYRKGNNEISSWFAQEGDFCWSAESFLKQEKGIEYIQAVEDSLVCCLSYANLRCICTNFPAFRSVEETVKQNHLLASEQRMQAMWMQRSWERLAWFQQRFPELMERASGKHIASYLGITEVMLSRLRHAQYSR